MPGINLKVQIATRRFDRDFDKDSRIIDGLKTPYRLHAGQGYLKKMFDLLLKYSSNPIEDSLKLWRRTVYNCLIGNTDNHIKNSSLMYSKDLSSIRLAPFYDVICTRVYESSTDEMSVSINGKQNINQIRKDDLEQEAKSCGLGSKAAMKIYDELHDGIKNALLDSADELSRDGFTGARPMAEKILGYIQKN